MSSQADLTGTTLGRFRLGPKLGAGGMGVVYLAEDQSLGRRVAVKVLPPELVADPVRRQRFLREAQSAAAVSHPNIAMVHDIGELGGCTFIVMEYIEGQSLRELLAQGQLSPSHALALGASVADAVAAAHAAGVVHRDLKPENIMLDAAGRPKVLDFGIAKLDAVATSPGQAVTPITREGLPIGTPGYMSPEQVRGVSVDHRTDVFSLGVILYEMLSGRPPFVGPTPFDVIVATTRDEPPAVSTLDARIPQRVAQIISACLAKDPAARPSSMATLASELRSVAGSLESLELGAAVAPRVTSTWTGDAPSGPVASPAFVHAATVAATPFAGAGSITPTPTPKKSRAPLLLAVGGLFTVLLALVLCGGVVALRSVDRGGKRARAAAGTNLKRPEVGLAAVDAYVSQHDSKSAARDTAAAWEAAAADFARANTARQAPVRWRAGEDFARGRAAFHRGRLDEAQKSFESAAKLEPEWALPALGLSDIYERRKDQPKALAAAQRAQQLDNKLWLGIRAGARAYLMVEDYTSAVSELRRALELAPKNALLLSELALTCHAAKMDENAESYAKQALALDGDLVNAHILLAERALEAKRGEDALAHAVKATEVQPNNVAAWLTKGDALVLLKRKDEARVAYKEALRVQDTTQAVGAPKERLDAARRAISLGTVPEPRRRAAVRSIPQSSPPKH